MEARFHYLLGRFVDDCDMGDAVIALYACSGSVLQQDSRMFLCLTSMKPTVLGARNAAVGRICVDPPRFTFSR